MHHIDLAKHIETHREQIIKLAVAAFFRDPFVSMQMRYVSQERVHVDLDHNLSAVIKAIRYRSPMILDDHIVWRRNMLLDHRCSTGVVRKGFAYIWTAITEVVPAQTHTLIHDYFAAAIDVLTYPLANVQQVSDYQDLLAEDLVAASFDSHWHWKTAYHVRGRMQMLYDAWMLVDFLIDSMGTNRLEVLGEHVRWYRDEVIDLGLSTTHVQQWLWLLSEAAEVRLRPGAAQDAQRMLKSAVSYLIHEREVCRELYQMQDSIVAEVATHLVKEGVVAQPETVAMDVGWYLSYLNDGLATGSAAALISYTQWVHNMLARQGLPDTTMRHSHAALEHVLDRYLSYYAAQEARAILQAAQQRF